MARRFPWTAWALFVVPAGACLAGECEDRLQEGRTAFAAQKFAAAVSALQRASQICAERVPVLISLAQTQYLLGEDEAAVANLRAAIAAEPGGTRAHYALGRIFYQQKQYPNAEAEFREVVRREPTDYRAWDNLGLTLDSLHRDAEAIDAFRRALDLVKTAHPDYDWAYANFAEFFLRREQFEKAFQLAAEAAHRNPQSARNAFLTGSALVKLGQDDKSERWLKRAIELDPGYAEAYYVLARVYRKLGRPDEARQQLDAFEKVRQTPRSQR